VKSEARLRFFHDPEMDPAKAGSIKGVGGWVIAVKFFIITTALMWSLSLCLGCLPHLGLDLDLDLDLDQDLLDWDLDWDLSPRSRG
jgi:hypothetical protein